MDDQAANIDILVNILNNEYELKVARSGPKGLELAQLGGVDLILLDVMMPEMNGFEVLTRLKSDSRTKAIPVVFISALSDAEDETFGLKIGAVDYIIKPFTPAIVLARVKNQLALADQQRHLEQAVRERTRELEDSRFEIIRRLGRAAEFADSDTGLHLIRVSNYAYLISQSAGISQALSQLIRDAAPLHDVGKIGISQQILSKPGKLTDQEMELVRVHCDMGRQIIGNHGSELLQNAALCAYCHHERWDGAGYPAGLKGDEIPLVARIVAIADVFDALTCERPYKPAWPAEDAVAEIRRCAGTQFDPALVEAFFDTLPEILEEMNRHSDEPHQGQSPLCEREVTPCTAR